MPQTVFPPTTAGKNTIDREMRETLVDPVVSQNYLDYRRSEIQIGW